MMTKQQIIDTLNVFTDDPNEEIFVFSEDWVLEINNISWYAQEIWQLPKNWRERRRMIGAVPRICLDANLSGKMRDYTKEFIKRAIGEEQPEFIARELAKKEKEKS